MPIDVPLAMSYQFTPVESRWDEDTIILYHLGIGAGRDPVDPRELEYTFESKLKVLPTFAVIPASTIVQQLPAIPGLVFNPIMALHGEQDLEIHETIPPAARATTTARLAGIYDKRKAALVVIETETRSGLGRLLFVNRFSVFLRGEGGFGGPGGPPLEHRLPTRDPDLVVDTPTLPQQALIYRLSGDKNPLHIDPEIARLAGYDRPILHGLCSYGIACKAAIDYCLEGDVTRLRRYHVRFKGVMIPGETLRTSIWREPGELLLTAGSLERQAPVLANARIELRE